jgi:hypothetical protein
MRAEENLPDSSGNRPATSHASIGKGVVFSSHASVSSHSAPFSNQNLLSELLAFVSGLAAYGRNRLSRAANNSRLCARQANTQFQSIFPSGV